MRMFRICGKDPLIEVIDQSAFRIVVFHRRFPFACCELLLQRAVTRSVLWMVPEPFGKHDVSLRFNRTDRKDVEVTSRGVQHKKTMLLPVWFTQDEKKARAKELRDVEFFERRVVDR